jgi:hypothetical protein
MQSAIRENSQQQIWRPIQLQIVGDNVNTEKE